MTERNPLAHRRRESSSQSCLCFGDFDPSSANIAQRDFGPAFGKLANQSPSFAPAVGNAVAEHRLALGSVTHSRAPLLPGLGAEFVAARFQFPEAIREDGQFAHLFFDADEFPAGVVMLVEPVG